MQFTVAGGAVLAALAAIFASSTADEPQATIIRPDGQRHADAVWPAADAAEVTLHFGPNGTLSPTPGSGSQQFTDHQSQTEAEMIGDPQTVKPNRLAFLTPSNTVMASRCG